MVTGANNKDAFITALEHSKMTADQNVQQAILKIYTDLENSAKNLKSAGQQITLNVDEIVDKLNAAKKDWLDHLSGTFDAVILRVKANLAALN